MARSSSGLGYLVLIQEITGSNPVRATICNYCPISAVGYDEGMVGLFEFLLPLLLTVGLVVSVIHRLNHRRPKLIIIDPLDFVDSYDLARLVGNEREIGDLVSLVMASNLEHDQAITPMMAALVKTRSARLAKDITLLHDLPLEPLGTSHLVTIGAKKRWVSAGSAETILSQSVDQPSEKIRQEIATAHRHGFLTIGLAGKFVHGQSLSDNTPSGLTFAGYAILEPKWNQVALSNLRFNLRVGSKLGCISRLPKEFLESVWEKQHWPTVQIIRRSEIDRLPLASRDKLLADIPAIAEATRETQYYVMKEWSQSYQCRRFAGRPYQEPTDSVK